MGLLQDFRYTVRLLRRSPGFLTVAVLTLALGVGANTAAFTLLDAMILRELPVDRPHELADVVFAGHDGSIHADLSYPLYVDFRDASRAFAGLAAYSDGFFGLSGGRATERVYGAYATDNYFDVLGVRPAMGSFFPGGAREPVAVISDGLWRRQFGSDPAAIGRAIVLNGRPFVIAGVAPRRFRGTVRGASADVWVPLSTYPSMADDADILERRTTSWLAVFGRILPQLTMREAQVRIQTAAQTLGPEARHWIEGARVVLQPGGRGRNYLIEEYETPLRLIMGAVAVVLLIACANLANLLLARGAGRAREVALRTALGASRARLIGQLLVESVTLAICGGALGLLLALWIGDAARVLPTVFSEPIDLDVVIERRVLVFCLSLSVATGLAFGILPALRVSRTDVMSRLKAGIVAPGSSPDLKLGHTLTGNLLIGSQVTMSLVLLVAAGLFLRSLWNLQAVDAGFTGRGVITLATDMELQGYGPEQSRDFYRQLLDRVAALPGVRSATLATTRPVSRGGRREQVPAGQTVPPIDRPSAIDVNVVAPAYFRTVGIPLVGGRDFSAADVEGAPRVIVVNETMARTYWPGRNPVGERFTISRETYNVIGVARDGKYRSLSETPRMTMYQPLLQGSESRLYLLADVEGDTGVAARTLERAVAAIDPRVAVFSARTLAEHVASSLAVDRVRARLLILFGVLALALAVVGMYGVLAYLVAGRTREIGVRMALGATAGHVIAIVVREALAVVAGGVVVGTMAALALGRAIASQLFGVAPGDALTIALSVLVLVASSAAAAIVPARRAARVDPVVALRYE